MGQPVRVAHVITRMIVGGAQELVLSIIRGLDPRRFESVLFTGPETGPEGSLLARARQAGVDVVEVPALVRAPRPARDFRAYRALRDAFRRGRFHIVNSYTSKAGFLGTLAARSAGVPVVVYSPQGHIFARGGGIEGVAGRPIRTRLFLALRRFASRRADALVALHDGDREEQVALGLAPPEKFRVIPNGIDPARFRRPPAWKETSLRRSLGLDGRFPVIASVGRLTTEKSHQDLVEAMATVRRDFPEALLLLVGGGPRREEIAAAARRLGVEGAVRFLGVREDVPDVLALADMFALASRYESFGLAVLEAMASARPVIATRVGGIPFLVREGATGLLFTPGRADDLARDPERSRAMGLAGEERFRMEFSREAMLSRVESLYEDLLTRKGVLQ